MIDLIVDESGIELEAGESGIELDVSEQFVEGGGSANLQSNKTVTPTTSQVQYLPDSGYDGLEKFTVEAIPSEYIIPSGTKSITENGSHDVTNYATASVAVPASAVDTGTKNITANGNGQDVVGYAAVNVNVPNSYAAADEGKVVQSGALVSQSSQNITENGTYDTTLKNEVVVDVQSGGDSRIPIMGGTGFSCDNTTENADYIKAHNNVLKLESLFSSGTGIVIRVTPSTLGSDETFNVDIKGIVKMGQQCFFNNSSPQYPSAIKKFTCDDDPNAVMIFSHAQQQFRYCRLLEEIHPRLSFTGLTQNYSNTWYQGGGEKLTYVRCVPNTLSYNFGFDNSSLLTDDSIVSAANAIKEGTTGTLKFHATPKARCASIMGTVSTVTEDEVTYSLFTADAQGATSLASFITDTKGWTLA